MLSCTSCKKRVIGDSLQEDLDVFLRTEVTGLGISRQPLYNGYFNQTLTTVTAAGIEPGTFQMLG
jgi:hypothetical protein